MAKLSAVQLATGSGITIIEMKDGLDGKASMSSDGKVFVELEFFDDKNIFEEVKAIRRYYRNGSKWSGAAPDTLKKFEGKDVPGEFITHPVKQYYDSGDVCYHTYTTFVMPHEDAEKVFASLGHPILKSEVSESTKVDLTAKSTQRLNYDYRNIAGEYLLQFTQRYGEAERCSIEQRFQKAPIDIFLMSINSHKYQIIPSRFTDKIISSPLFMFEIPHSKCVASLLLLDIWNQISNVNYNVLTSKELYDLSVGIIKHCEHNTEPLVPESLFI